MKSTLYVFFLRMTPLLALASLSARAENPIPPIETVQVGKTTFNEQTGAGTVNLISGENARPFGFTASVIPHIPDGPLPAYSNGLTFPSPQVTFPESSGMLSQPAHNFGYLGFNIYEKAWNYGSPNFNNWGTATRTELDTLFPNGTYSFFAFGQTIALNLSAPTGLSAPVFTLTGGGSWVNGKYLIDVSQSLTITSSVFAGFDANQNGFMAYQLERLVSLGDPVMVGGNVYLNQANSLLTFNGSAITPSSEKYFSYTIAPGTLTAGSEYQFTGFFDAVVASDSTTWNSFIGPYSSYNVAYEEQSTTFKLLAVPEPSTYAALIGACAVVFAAWRKRRAAIAR